MSHFARFDSLVEFDARSLPLELATFNYDFVVSDKVTNSGIEHWQVCKIDGQWKSYLSSGRSIDSHTERQPVDPPMVPATGPATVDGEKTAGHKLVREFSSDVLRRPRLSSELLLSPLKQVSGDVLSTSISDGVLLRLQEDDNALRFH